MKILSWNVNGIRAREKSLSKWLKKENPDIFCLQEIKSNIQQIPDSIKKNKKYYQSYNIASKKGYSGVTIYSKEKPKSVEKKLGLKKFDKEGRFLMNEFDNFTLINVYLPHGGRQKENLKYKLGSYKKLFEIIKNDKNKNIILIGDFNIAHKMMDLARPKQNRNNIMFTKEERNQLDILLNFGFIDSFRTNDSEGGNYTWWPYAFNARKRNLGWRIDYCFVSDKIKTELKTAFIQTREGDSDHCPIGIEIDI